MVQLSNIYNLMLKNLLRLLATSASLVALLLFANTALAASSIDNAQILTIKQSELQLVNLNVISPTLELTNQSHNSLLQHFGCSCPVCNLQ
jgi:hypothetical protein